MNALIREILETGFVSDAAGEKHAAFPAAIHAEDGEALYRLASADQPLTTLEVGMGFGLSSLYICQALRDGHGGRHLIIDPYQSGFFKSIGMLNLERAGLLDLVTLHEGRSQAVLPRLLEQGEQLDIAFVDRNHRFEYMLADFLYIDRMLRVGGHIVFHDTWMPSTRKLLTFLANIAPPPRSR